MTLSDSLTARSFSTAEGVADWRVCDGGASAWYGCDSLGAGAQFALAVSELPEVGARPVDLDLRPDGVAVRLFTYAPSPDGLSQADLVSARAISALARSYGLVADPAAVSNLVVNIGASDLERIAPFWHAVLGYDLRDGELNDPRRRGPVVCFQQLQQSHPGRPRTHVDVWVPHDEAQGRVDAALGAGGRLLSDEPAPAWWVLADPEDNEACVATWIGTDGAGCP